MKKLLLASTALVATAGFAAADVGLSGSAEMGVKRSNFNDVAEFHTDISVTFSLSGESDNGLSFGASIGLEEAQDGVDTDVEDDFSVFISSGPATLTMGDTDGAFDKALTEVAVGAGSIADDHTAHAGYSGNGGFASLTIDESVLGVDLNGDLDTLDTVAIIGDSTAATFSLGTSLDGVYDGQIARFDYSFGDFVGSLSVEMDDSENDTNDPIWGIGVAYSADLGGTDFGLGLAYQAANDIGSAAGISLSGGWANGVTAVFNYSSLTADFDGSDVTWDHTAIGLGYDAGAMSFGINYGVFTAKDGFANIDDGDQISSGWGFAAAYDFGGGLQAQFGYGASMYADEVVDFAGAAEDTTDSFSLGLAMSF